MTWLRFKLRVCVILVHVITWIDPRFMPLLSDHVMTALRNHEGRKG